MNDHARVPITVKQGGLYIDRTACLLFFPGIETVILLRRDDDLVVLPVTHAAAGGYLLKLRNSAGDRVVNAADFFRSHAIDDEMQCDWVAEWSEEWSGLCAKNVFKCKESFQLEK